MYPKGCVEQQFLISPTFWDILANIWLDWSQPNKINLISFWPQVVTVSVRVRIYRCETLVCGEKKLAELSLFAKTTTASKMCVRAKVVVFMSISAIAEAVSTADSFQAEQNAD